MFPVMACRTSSALGCGLWFSSARALINCPEVQKPHCGPSCWMKASWSGSSLPFCASPSTVTTLRPSAHTASWLHEYTFLPSSSTVQAPHSPRSQPIFEPVSPRWSRSTSASVQRSSTSILCAVPLTVTLMAVRGTPGAAAPGVCPLSGTVVATRPAPVPSTNLRREILLMGIPSDAFSGADLIVGGPKASTEHGSARLAVGIRTKANYCLAPLALGPPSSALPTNTVRPSGSFTERELQVLVASLARKPSMMISSPGLSVPLLHPWRVRPLGAPPSHCQCATAPVSSLTSRYSQTCGFS